jgi:hypothetical protein
MAILDTTAACVSKIGLAICASSAILVVGILNAHSEVKLPDGTNPISIPLKKGVSKLSEAECGAAKGMVIKKLACDTGQACAVKDEDSIWHYVCLSKPK